MNSTQRPPFDGLGPDPLLEPLLASARCEEAWGEGQRQQLLRRIRQSALEGRRPGPLIAGLGAFTAAAALVTVVLAAHAHGGPARSPSGHGAGSGALVASPGARYQLSPASSDGREQLEISSGALALSSPLPRRLSIRGPHFHARVEAQMVQVKVESEVTTLSLQGGGADIEGADGILVHLSGGEVIRSDDPRLASRRGSAAPPTPGLIAAPSPGEPASPLAMDQCARSGAGRRGCYLLAAMGEDLAAQNALLELGFIDRDERHDGRSAVDFWRAYQVRFPSGPLGPEASMAVLAELLAEHDRVGARAEANQFLTRYPEDSRASEVRLVAANLDCERAVHVEPILGRYDQLMAEAPALADQIRLARAACAGRQGRDDARPPRE